MAPSMPSVTDNPKQPKVDTAIHVFGQPVTNDTVKKLFPGKEDVTNRDRAYVAYNLKDEDDKQKHAASYAAKLYYLEGLEDKVATVCVIYNATGGPVELFKVKDFEGGAIKGEGHPKKLENGQWAAFLHVGSHAAVVYRSQNELLACAWVHAWHNSGRSHGQSVFTEIQKPDHYENDDDLTSLKSWTNLDEVCRTTGIGCYSAASIVQLVGFPAKYTGIMTLEDISPSPSVEKYLYD